VIGWAGDTSGTRDVEGLGRVPHVRQGVRGPNKTGEAQTIVFIKTTQPQVDALGKNRRVPQVSLLRPGIRATDPKWKPQFSLLSSQTVAECGKSLRRLGRNERGLSAFLYVGGCSHGFQSVDIKVFVQIKTEEIGCSPEDKGAIQKLA
jgi:hypothetical protein